MGVAAYYRWIAAHPLTSALAVAVAVIGGAQTLTQGLPALGCDALRAAGVAPSLCPDPEAEREELVAAIAARVAAEVAAQGRGPLDAEAATGVAEAARETAAQGDPAERAALDLIAEGEIAAGLDGLEAAARAAEARLAERWRNIGRLAFPVDTQRALEAYAKARALDGSEPWDAIYLAHLQLRAGDAQAALAMAEAALAALSDAAPRDRMVLQGERGDALTALGDLPGALSAYRAGMAIAEDLAARDPENEERRRDLTVWHNKVGDVLRAQGDLPGALSAYRAGMAIAEDLAARDPENAEWRRDLSVSHERIGEVLAAQGDLPGALSAYRAGMAIRRDLAALDPANAGWRRDLSVSHNKVGDVLRAQGDLPGALSAYRAGMAIRRDLAALDPENAECRRDLSASHNKVGDVLAAQGDLPGALSAYRAGMAIGRDLAALDPENAEWRRGVAASLWRLAEIPGSGVGWAEVAAALRAMQADGVLAPADEGALAEAERRAGAAAAE